MGATMTRGEWDKRCRGCNHTETEHGPGIQDWSNNCKVCRCGGFQPCDCERCQATLGYPCLGEGIESSQSATGRNKK